MIGDNIKRIREARGMKQWELGELMGVSDGAVSAWETGRNSIGVEQLEALSAALRCTRDELLNDTIPPYSGISDLQDNATTEVPDSIIERRTQAAAKEARRAQLNREIAMSSPSEPSSIDQAALAIASIMRDPTLSEAVVAYTRMSPEKQKSILDFIKFQSSE